MADVIIACENLKDEIEYILNDLKISCNVIYIESQLHNNPNKLNERLQSEIDKYVNANSILLLFGLCGNGLIGLKSKNANIIYPKVDDCISLYLGGVEKRKKLHKSIATYFFTKRYIENELSIYNEMQLMKHKYGEKKTNKIYKSLFQKYEYIRTINTGTYEVDDILDKINEMCEIFGLKHENVDADLSLFYKAFNENYDENFIVVPKNKEIKLEYFQL